MSFLADSAIVVCHPDDETLWFGSILGEVERVIVAYEDAWFDPGLGDRRRAALADFPREIESLGMDEAGSAGCANWKRPRLSRYGLRFGAHVRRMDAKTMALRAVGRPRTEHPTRRAHYVSNFKELDRSLRARLAGIRNVFTHNPWGEYGHEDHVQMFRVLDAMRDEIGFDLWMSNYVTERSLPLALTYLANGPAETIVRDVDKHLCDAAAAAYRDAGCWTWADDWRWFDTETFRRAPRGQREATAQSFLMPLNLFNIDPVTLA